MDSERKWGSVKFYNSYSGYGFISVDGQKDLFFHHSSLAEEVKQEDLVEFEEGEGKGGKLQALNIIKIEKEDDDGE